MAADSQWIASSAMQLDDPAGLRSAKPRFELKIGSLHRARDIALESFERKFEATDPDGNFNGTVWPRFGRHAPAGRWTLALRDQ